MENVNITIIGAGVVGLAVARELASHYKNILIIEKNSSFGQETSSRNSEVIHAGIYYSKDSQKTKLCIEGRKLLYEFCVKNNIPHKNIKKLIVAIDESEVSDLEKLYNNGLANGVDDLKLISKEDVKNIEPNINAYAAIYSPSTGIIDSHSFMKALESQFRKQGGEIAYNAQVVSIDKTEDGFVILVKEPAGDIFKFASQIIINCAGLNCHIIAAMAGLNQKQYQLKYCKGDYFRIASSKIGKINHLIYPVPKKDRAGLGIHATLDLAGSMRLGPDDEYVDKISYDVNPAKAVGFYESAKQFMPFLTLEDLAIDTSGMRPKLQGPGENFRDFIIKDESDNNLSGFINLLGIESPGLTASLAIARMVNGLVKQYD